VYDDVRHAQDPEPERVVGLSAQVLVQLVHGPRSTLPVEAAAVVLVEERPLLALELPAINRGLLTASLYADLDFSLYVLSANHFLLFVALISQVL